MSPDSRGRALRPENDGDGAGAGSGSAFETPRARAAATAAALAKGQRTRTRILDAAQQLFARGGYNVASLREIAAHAGLTHVGVLHHFEGREAILLALLERRDAAQLAELVSAGDARQSPERTLRVVLVIAEDNLDDPMGVALFVKLAAEATQPGHPARPYMVRRYRRAIGLVSAAFAGLFVAQGRHDDPDRAARDLFALIDGLQLQWALDDFSAEAGASMMAGIERFFASFGFTPPREDIDATRAVLRSGAVAAPEARKMER